MSAFSIPEFRASFPEFSDLGKYPNAMVNVWADLAVDMVNKRLWRGQTALGRYLYVAHELTLQAQSAAAAAIGGVPGQQSGQMNNKTVGSVSVGYDTTASSEKDAGWWNLTTYGKQFIRLARIFGAGGIQL